MTLRARFQKLIDLGAIDCTICGAPIVTGMKWDLDHAEPRTFGGAVWDVDAIAPAHSSCNRRLGQRITTAKRRARARRRAPPDEPRIW